MVDKSLRKSILEMCGEDLVVFENPSYDNSIIGITHDNRVLYDYNMMIGELSEDEGISYEEAMEFIDYNTLGSLNYIENSPIVMMIAVS